MNAKIEGSYLLTKSGLHREGVELVIGTRKKPDISKPKHYLLQKLSSKRFIYVSSLYPLNDASTAFSLDYAGKQFSLEISKATESAKIELLNSILDNGHSISMSISAVQAHKQDKTDTKP